jgi:hypothetical protein
LPQLQQGHDEADLRSQSDLVADPDVRPLGHDAICTVDVTADQVFEKVVAVESAASLPQLGDPRPYVIGRGANGDGAGCGEIGIFDEVIAGEGLGELVLCRAPAEMSGPSNEDVGGGRASNCSYARS